MSERSRLLPELEALAQGVPWPVIASAADSQIAYANPAWFAYTRDGDTGGSYERWLDAIHEQDLPTTRRLWLRATRQGSTFEHR
ncbi:MAG TPA: hypothetical protein VM491_17045, partial [Burkholderiaceae bacterium]|nr:hypothetical protein [Burkholderiaceae bacterium]